MWRWQTASSVLPTIILLTLIFACPESPRFLMKHQRYKEAYKTLLLLRGERILAAKELLYIHYQTEVEMRQLGHAMADPEADDGPRLDRPGRGERPYLRRPGRGLNYYQKLRQLFTVRRIRRAMIAAVVCMVGQQMCGKWSDDVEWSIAATYKELRGLILIESHLVALQWLMKSTC